LSVFVVLFAMLSLSLSLTLFQHSFENYFISFHVSKYQKSNEKIVVVFLRYDNKLSQHEIWWINIIFWARLPRSLPTAFERLIFRYLSSILRCFFMYVRHTVQNLNFKNSTRIFFCSFFFGLFFAVAPSLLFIVSFEWKEIPKFLIYILINIVNESFSSLFPSRVHSFDVVLSVSHSSFIFDHFSMLCVCH
jgi:ABC-type Fe3+-siderophore transport system permease subunit